MQKLFINATVMADDNLDTGLVQRLLTVLGDARSVAVTAVRYRPREDRNATVWVFRDSDDGEPYVLVNEPFDFEGEALTEDQVQVLMQEGVCIGMRAYHPRTDRYGTPDWATDPQHGTAEMMPSQDGFYIAHEGFEAAVQDTHDDSSASFWYQIALPENCEVVKFFEEKREKEDAAFWDSLVVPSDSAVNVDDEENEAHLQQLCDRIRRNMTEEEMTAALEGAGFAVSETGHELVVALASSIDAGDVSESVLDN